MQKRSWILGAGGTGTALGDAGLLVLRLGAGFLLLWLHGLGKFPPGEGFVGYVGSLGLPAPILVAWAAALAETLGAVLIAVGLLARPAALYVVLHFLGVVFIAHAGDPMSDRELGALFALIALLVATTGAGRFSVDAILGRRKGG